MVIPGPINIFWSGKEFKSKGPLNRYMGSGKRHRPIHGYGKEEACLHQISNNLVMITLNLPSMQQVKIIRLLRESISFQIYHLIMILRSEEVIFFLSGIALKIDDYT